GDPAFTPRIPCDGTAVRLDGLVVRGGCEACLRLEFFPCGGILPAFEGGGAAECWKWIAEKDPFFAARIFPEGRVTVRKRRRFRTVSGFGPEHPFLFEIGGGIIPDAEAPFVNLERRFDLHVGGNEMRRAVLV